MPLKYMWQKCNLVEASHDKWNVEAGWFFIVNALVEQLLYCFSEVPHIGTNGAPIIMSWRGTLAMLLVTIPKEEDGKQPALQFATIFFNNNDKVWVPVINNDVHSTKYPMTRYAKFEVKIPKIFFIAYMGVLCRYLPISWTTSMFLNGC